MGGQAGHEGVYSSDVDSEYKPADISAFDGDNSGSHGIRAVFSGLKERMLKRSVKKRKRKYSPAKGGKQVYEERGANNRKLTSKKEMRNSRSFKEGGMSKSYQRFLEVDEFPDEDISSGQRDAELVEEGMWYEGDNRQESTAIKHDVGSGEDVEKAA
ncbi:MAG: hypothetical protein ACPGO5_05150 [Patescibacteria group bacterium]